MPRLQLEVPSLEDVEDTQVSLRELYVDKKGKFVLDVDGDPSGALRRALVTERTTAGTASGLAKQLMGDRSLEDTLELIQLGERAQSGAPVLPDEERERIKTTIQTRANRDIEKKDTTIGKLTTQLNRVLSDDAARTALKAEDGDVDLLLPHVLAKIEVVEDPNTGEFTQRVKGDKPKEYALNDNGDPMTVAELVSEMRDDPKFATAFASRVVTGSGAEPRSTVLPDTTTATGSRRSQGGSKKPTNDHVSTLVQRKLGEGSLAL